MYEKLKQAIQDGMYTVTEAVNLLNAFLQTGQITADQFTELFEMTKGLPVNGEKKNLRLPKIIKKKNGRNTKKK